MMTPTQRSANTEAYRRLRDELERTYPAMQFVALAEGKVVADSKDFDELQRLLRQQGIEAGQSLVVRIGDEPEGYVEFLPLGEFVSHE